MNSSNWSTLVLYMIQSTCFMHKINGGSSGYKGRKVIFVSTFDAPNSKNSPNRRLKFCVCTFFIPLHQILDVQLWRGKTQKRTWIRLESIQRKITSIALENKWHKHPEIIQHHTRLSTHSLFTTFDRRRLSSIKFVLRIIKGLTTTSIIEMLNQYRRHATYHIRNPNLFANFHRSLPSKSPIKAAMAEANKFSNIIYLDQSIDTIIKKIKESMKQNQGIHTYIKAHRLQLL